MSAKRETEGESEPCRGMLQTEGSDTNWGVGSVSLRGIFIFSVELDWGNIHRVMADVRSVCVGVISLLFSCSRDALSVNKRGRMKEIRGSTDKQQELWRGWWCFVHSAAMSWAVSCLCDIFLLSFQHSLWDSPLVCWPKTSWCCFKGRVLNYYY